MCASSYVATDMENLFELYSSKFDELKDLEQDELPRSLRLFNIRFRLAIDIEISFKGEISLTKSIEVRDTYVLIVQLMETWNAYEAFVRYAKEVSPHTDKSAGKSKIFSQKALMAAGSMPILSDALYWLKSEYDANNRFKGDFEQYITRIHQDSNLSKTLSKDAKDVLAHLNNEKTISGIELLSLIYAERNMYYHNGETAKMGMAYTNRKSLINKYRDTLALHTLKLAIYIIDEQINNNK